METQTTPRLRASDSVRGIEIMFRGKWVMLGSLTGTTWSYPDKENRNAAYKELAQQCHSLFLAAPAQMEALAHWVEHVETSTMPETVALKGWLGKARAALDKAKEA